MIAFVVRVMLMAGVDGHDDRQVSEHPLQDPVGMTVCVRTARMVVRWKIVRTVRVRRVRRTEIDDAIAGTRPDQKLSDGERR